MKSFLARFIGKRQKFQSPPAGYLNPHSTLGELDMYLITEGRHENLWDVLGAHVRRDLEGELIGTAFAVWAPNARSVSLICDNNFWDRKTNPMIPLGSNGLWEIFLPDLGPGTKYKFAIEGRDGKWVDHADPMARQTEVPPHTASIVNESTYQWSDAPWMTDRAMYQPWKSPISVYEVHLGSWKPGLSYRELAKELGDYVLSQGFTHTRFDGTALYEHEDPRLGEHPDWGTLIFNFGRNEVRNFLVSSALYWFEEFHIDGLRVDAVASMLYLDYSRKEGEWVPNEFGGRENLAAVRFLQEATATAYKRYPGIMMIAEESTAWGGVTKPTSENGLGFGFKWNMGWMHDTLKYLHHEPVHRVYHHNEITFSILYAWSENFLLPLSHDEVVHGKGALVNKFPGDRWQKLATLRALYGYMWAHPGKKLLFMGSEFAQNDEWRESQSLDWHLTQYEEHSGVQQLISDINHEYQNAPALWQKDVMSSGFQWLIGDDGSGNTLAFARWADDGSALISVTNFSPVPHERYRLPVPKSGPWKEIINTDSLKYGGSGFVNSDLVLTDVESHGCENSLLMRLPPLATIWISQA